MLICIVAWSIKRPHLVAVDTCNLHILDVFCTAYHQGKATSFLFLEDYLNNQDKKKNYPVSLGKPRIFHQR